MGNKDCNVDFTMSGRGLLARVRKLHPELRLCQILSIAAYKAGWTDNDLFYCPDSTILKGLELLAEQPESEENQNGCINRDENC